MLSIDESIPDGQRLPWHEVWMDVVTYPSRDTFRRILDDPTAGQARAYIWMAILGILLGIFQVIFFLPFFSKISLLQPFDFSPAMGILILIGAPIGLIISLVIRAAIFHGVARLLKGEGTFSDMVYCLGAIDAPVMIVSYLLSLIMRALMANTFTSPESLLSADMSSLLIPRLILLTLSMAISIYIIVLEVIALDVIHKFGTGKAILTVLSPIIPGFLLCLCWVAILPIIIFSRM